MPVLAGQQALGPPFREHRPRHGAVSSLIVEAVGRGPKNKKNPAYCYCLSQHGLGKKRGGGAIVLYFPNCFIEGMLQGTGLVSRVVLGGLTVSKSPAIVGFGSKMSLVGLQINAARFRATAVVRADSSWPWRTSGIGYLFRKFFLRQQDEDGEFMNEAHGKVTAGKTLKDDGVAQARAGHRSRKGQFQGRVVLQEEIAHGHNSLVVELCGAGGGLFWGARAGQFVQVACRDLSDAGTVTPTLRRPFSLAGVTGAPPGAGEPGSTAGAQGTYVELIYRICGPGTRYLAQRIAGDPIDLLGPLGNGFTVAEEAPSRAILVGGGVGLPPLFFLAQQLRAQSPQSQVVAIAAGRSQGSLVARLALQDYRSEERLAPQPVVVEFSRYGVDSLLATDDGSCGYQGTAAAALAEFLEQQPGWCDATVYTCGPDQMLRTVALESERLGMPCQVCMEAYMACGIGVCQSCAVPIRSEQVHAETGEKWHYRLACMHGPVFDAKTVLWDHPRTEK